MQPVASARFVLSTPAILIGAAPTDLVGIEICAPEWLVFAADGGVPAIQGHQEGQRGATEQADDLAAWR